MLIAKARYIGLIQINEIQVIPINIFINWPNGCFQMTAFGQGNFAPFFTAVVISVVVIALFFVFFSPAL